MLRRSIKRQQRWFVWGNVQWLTVEFRWTVTCLRVGFEGLTRTFACWWHEPIKNDTAPILTYSTSRWCWEWHLIWTKSFVEQWQTECNRSNTERRVPRADVAAIHFTHTAVLLDTTSVLNWQFVTSALYKCDGFHCYKQQTLHQTRTTLTLAGNKYVSLCKCILLLNHSSGEKGKRHCRSQVFNPLLNDVSELKTFPFL
jgi:hypothetical protein